MSLQPEMKGFYKFLKEKELSNERDRLLARFALTTMSPRDFMDEYPCLHEKVQPVGVDFQVFDTVKSDCGIIGYISNFSEELDLYEVRVHGEPGSYNFTKSRLKHHYNLQDEHRKNVDLDTFLEGLV